jgi:hypothetical protein
MGEAKRKREMLRAEMIRKTREWMEPPSAEEAELAERILRLEPKKVRRLDREQIAWMRMPANHCHANVGWYVKNDPTGESKHISGWLLEWPDATLHSVLGRDGEYMCITPTPFGDQWINFIPDGHIEWKETGDVYSPFRDDRPIPSRVRRFPEFTIARSEFVIRRLESGTNPYDAINIPMSDFGTMIAEHVPPEFWPENMRLESPSADSDAEQAA